MSSTKPLWLGRSVAAPGPYLQLCLSEAEYESALKRLKIKADPAGWLSTAGCDATTHTMTNKDGGLACLVCLKPTNRQGVQVAALLVHEAVHVWQAYAAHIGETAPGAEQEAYAIQAISQQLMTEFARRRVS